MNFLSDKHRHYVISNVIVTSQIFGDGNHRTCIFYLTTFAGMRNQEANDTLANIENIRHNMFSCPYPEENPEYHKRYEKQISQKLFL
jgi:hypothetical protein